MRNRVKKGNALVVVTLILFGISLIAAALAMYFSVANRLVEKNSRYFYMKNRLSSYANENYRLLLINEDITIDDYSTINLNTKISELDSLGETYTFTYKTIQNEFSCTSFTDSDNKKIDYVVKTTFKGQEYIYSVVLELNDGQYELTTKETFEEHALS